MFVEDKLSHRGPFPIQVTAEETVGELKKQIEKDFEIPANVQRWILGKELATDDKSTLKDHHVTNNGCPVFLYLVAPTRGIYFKLTKIIEFLVSLSKNFTNLSFLSTQIMTRVII